MKPFVDFFSFAHSPTRLLYWKRWEGVSYKRIIVFFCFAFCCVLGAYAQVTKGGLKGRVKAGENAVANAVVELVNKATGEKFTTTTDAKGNYVFFNLTPGTDYTINVFGSSGQTDRDGIAITLGADQILDLDFTRVLEEVKVSATPTNNNRNVMGAGTTVEKKTILEIPAFNRSLTDITKLTPQSNGFSMAGMNNRFNNITIDGAITNDAFGLGSTEGLPGGSVGTQPISLDAIQEMQIVLSPYNVQYGNFTGGGVNAITRSGTNKLEGSAYFFTKNSALTGKDPITKSPTSQFSEYTAGFRVGGPIIKDKLFYFVNYEFVQRTEPSLFNAGENGSVISKDSAQKVVDIFKDSFGYDPGSYGPLPIVSQSHKALVKFTYNISDQHKVSLRYNLVSAFRDDFFSDRSRQNFTFGNGRRSLSNLQNVVVAELNSSITSKASNSLIVSFTSFDDSRKTVGKYFPQIQWNTQFGNLFIGSESYSNGNGLRQNIIEVTDNFKLHHNNYTFTFGTHNELFMIFNSFTPRKNGAWQSKNELTIEQLKQIKQTNGSTNKDVWTRFRGSYPVVPNGNISRLSLAQFGVYAQAEGNYWQNRLKVTFGMRIDVPVFFTRPLSNPDFERQFSYVNNTLPTRVLYSPRLGFNLDADGKKNIIVRGGIGVFSGRLPFVWLSNAIANDGIRMASIDKRDPKFKFNPDVNAIPGLENNTSFSVNTIDKNFHFPQVLRANLAADFKIPGRVYVTIEGIFTKTINNVFYQIIGLTKGSTYTKTPLHPQDSFPVYDDPKYLVNGAEDSQRSYGGGIYHLTNTQKGYTYNISIQARKDFRFLTPKAGVLSLMAAYTYSRAFDVSSTGESIAASGYRDNPVPANTDFNNPPLATSNYELRHRFIATLSYTIPYSPYAATTIFFFLRSNSGLPYSLVYNRQDLNGDKANFNDLLYIPTEAELQAQSGSLDTKHPNAINNFINSSPEVQAQRGKFIARNSVRTPWETVLDMRILQNFIAHIQGRPHTFQLSLEIFNLTNLLNNNWGRVYNSAYNGGAGPWGEDKSKKVTLQTSNTTKQPWTIKDTYSAQFNSRWQMQLGFRYIF